MKPKHYGGYTEVHVQLCERTLVTLLRGLGPWKQGIYLAGGLVPRYLIPRMPDENLPPHVGTTDVDLVLDLEVLAKVEAYRRLEQNLKSLGFERGRNEEGLPQHFSWRKPVGGGVTVVVDLLCDAPTGEGGRIESLAGERRLSALKIPGAHLVIADYTEIPLTADLLDGQGTANELIRVANIVPFIVLKSLAYEDRMEQKDAYDIVYCVEHYESGPADVAAQFANRLQQWPDEPLLPRALDILRDRFVSDARTQGHRKDGPGNYALFLTDPGRTELDAQRRQNASAAIDALLQEIGALTQGKE